MADFLIQDCAAENAVVYDTNKNRRLGTGVALASALVEQGWTVFVYSCVNGDGFLPVVDGRRLRRHVPLDAGDVSELVDSASRERTAVVIDGLITTAGGPMKRLLKQTNIFVLTLTSVRSVRGDHRYGRLWTPGKQWRLREEPKDFTIVEVEAVPAAEPGWLSWLW